MPSSPPELEHETRVREHLERIYGKTAATGNRAFVRSGMYPAELVRLHELISQNQCRSALEIGMANGTSSIVLCDALKANGGGRLTSIDPFQTTAPPTGYDGAGLKNVMALGFETMHRLIEQLDYLALPQLVAQGEKFDFIFIDGYHSFDYTFIDLFFADLLLEDRGILAVHDTVWASVNRAMRWLESHKPYERLSPPLWVNLTSVRRRILRRIGITLRNPATLKKYWAPGPEWGSLSAYRKLKSHCVPETFDHPF